MKKPKLSFPPGTVMGHLLFHRGKQTVLKKSIREHMDVDIGDYVAIRAVSPGVVLLEKVNFEDMDSKTELAMIDLGRLRMPSPTSEEGEDK